MVDGSSTANPLMALAILLTPEALYEPDSPMVGLGLVYKAPYIRTTSWTEAYFHLKLASQAEASRRTTESKVIFVLIQTSSRVIPLPGVLTQFLDVKSPEDIADSKAAQPPQDFRGFRLHEVVFKGDDPPTSQVAFPRLQGSTECSWTLKQRQVLPPELKESPQITVALSPADPHHWNIVNNPIYPSCLDTFKAKHEASLALEAASSAGEIGSQGESSTPTQESPLVAWPQPPSTPPPERWEINTRVTQVLDQMHNLHLQLLQEMGFVREVDKALAKSLMVEFFRLQTIITDDLNGALQTWQAKTTTATHRLLRDLDAAVQRDATLPSQNAAVGVALCQFQTAARMRLALPLTRLEEAQDAMEGFMRFRLDELRSQRETKDLVVELSYRVANHRSRVREILRGRLLGTLRWLGLSSWVWRWTGL